MNTLTAPRETAPPEDRMSRPESPKPDALPHLKSVIEHAAHLLPAQGPITVFIHHNTLHAFEDLPFTEGVKKGAITFGCQPFLSEQRYREALGRGRIRFAGLEAVLNEDLRERASETVAGLCSRRELRLAMLQYPVRTAPSEELRWFVAETDALRKVRPEASAAARGRLIAETRRWVMRDLRGGAEVLRNGTTRKPRSQPPRTLMELIERFGEQAIEDWDDAAWEEFTLQVLWRVCLDGTARVPVAAPVPAPLVRHRDLLEEAAGVDIDPWINDILIPFCAAFLDQGFAHWPLPGREQGFYRSFCTLYRRPGGPPNRWLHGLAAELARLEEFHIGPLESIRESLDLLGVPEDEWESYLSQTFLALRGWGGMVRQVEIRRDSVAHAIPNGSLIEFLAVRLILERLAVEYAARTELAYRGPLHGVRSEASRRIAPTAPPSLEQRAFSVFELAQVLGWTPDQFYRLSEGSWSALHDEIASFSSLERRQTFHLAYERRFLVQSLDALALHSHKAGGRPRNPRFQVITCLDEREESFRRHLEEVAPDVETFGAAGYFAVPMYYRGSADAHYVPLCPIVLTPKHWVREQVDEGHEQSGERRSWYRSLLGRAAHRVHTGSRSAALGAFLTTGLGVLASFPLIMRILFPRLTARLRQRVGRVVQPPPATRLQLERKDVEPGPNNGQVGFTPEEMVSMAERLLRDLGLIDGFARLAFTIGHGAFSLNNPHKSAYDCGACGGSPGAPNGRAIAFLLNDRRVREGLVPMRREDRTDLIFATENGKFKYVLDEMENIHKTGRPVLVGTVSIEKSEKLAALLRERGIKDFQVLNAKYHEREAAIISNAGKKSQITIATNMAGRGTDIKLAEGVREIGGLAIIGTERHESRRIDNQLRGRSGRQGDPGTSRFYVSLEDEVARLFGGDRIKRIIAVLGGDAMDEQPLDQRMVTRSIERAQRQVEEYNFEIRKNLLKYDDVMNKQREVIYRMRRDVLEDRDITEQLQEMAADLIYSTLDEYAPKGTSAEDWDLEALLKRLRTLFSFEFSMDDHTSGAQEAMADKFIEQVKAEYEARRAGERATALVADGAVVDRLALRSAHSEAELELREELLHFLQVPTPEALRLQQLGFGAAAEIAHRLQLEVRQHVGRVDRHFELVEAARERVGRRCGGRCDRGFIDDRHRSLACSPGFFPRREHPRFDRGRHHAEGRAHHEVVEGIGFALVRSVNHLREHRCAACAREPARGGRDSAERCVAPPRTFHGGLRGDGQEHAQPGVGERARGLGVDGEGLLVPRDRGAADHRLPRDEPQRVPRAHGLDGAADLEAVLLDHALGALDGGDEAARFEQPVDHRPEQLGEHRARHATRARRERRVDGDVRAAAEIDRLVEHVRPGLLELRRELGEERVDRVLHGACVARGLHVVVRPIELRVRRAEPGRQHGQHRHRQGTQRAGHRRRRGL